MKKLFSYILAMLCTLPLYAATGDDASAVSIATFYGNHLGAVSYTFDDGLLEHYTQLFPVVKRLGLKCSFCINGSAVNSDKPSGSKPRMTWEMMKEMHRDGQEITSHGWAHKSMQRVTGESLRYEVQHNDTCIFENVGTFPRTYFYPGNVKTEEGVAFASRDRVGTRTFQVSIGSKRSAQWLHKWIRTLVAERKWGVGMTHGISTGYDHFLDPQILFDHLADAASMQDSLWIATFHDVSAYIAERDNVALTVTTGKNELSVKPKLTLDKNLFTVPLTLLVPDETKSARQNGKKLEILQANGRKFVNFNPWGGTVTLK